MIGRVWTWDEQHAGAYFMDDDVLMHAPLALTGGVEWDNPAEVDYDSIDEDIAAEAARAEGRLRGWLEALPTAAGDFMRGARW